MFEKIRSKKVNNEEIIADFIFLLVSFIAAIIALYIFDIHWNFYPGGQIFPPAKHIFTDKTIYLRGGLVGAIAGFFLIKIFLAGLKEEEIAWRQSSKSQKMGRADRHKNRS